MHVSIIMRTTITIDNELFEKASKLTGIKEKSKLIREAMAALVARESGIRLAKLGGTCPDLPEVSRRKTGS